MLKRLRLMGLLIGMLALASVPLTPAAQAQGLTDQEFEEFAQNLANFSQGLEAYENGDYATALKKWRPLAEQGFTEVQLSLGNMYALGEGVEQDYATAIEWYIRDAEQDYAIAQNNLGSMYERGLGVKQNYAKAVEWYRKSVEHGYAIAQNNLGVLYQNGNGVAQNDGIAAELYRQAAEQGYAPAQHNLGFFYLSGQGVIPNLQTAHIWYNIANVNGSEQSRVAKEWVETLLSPNQINTANRLAQQCLDSSYTDCP